jgi:hypothetical protein
VDKRRADTGRADEDDVSVEHERPDRSVIATTVQIAIVVVGFVVLPFYLGARHIRPEFFVLTCIPVGLLITAGVHLLSERRTAPRSGEIVAQTLLRMLAAFFGGCVPYILGYVLL